MSSNELGLNAYFLGHLEALRRDMVWRYLNGHYSDAVDSMWMILSQLPSTIKDDRLSQWETEILSLRQRAQKHATGQSKTTKAYNRAQGYQELCRQFMQSNVKQLHLILHEAGLFTAQVGGYEFYDPSGGRPSP